ncbi:prephenate dehydratase [Maridesulfovibrio salexigens]|uniref:Bifunctional chorismate mutase/prephenate dehydratase n=1 Tax=Maridesulfovibrio salexigens (strain ATCC 14822 / DSM 2638 / NCIMB 8403 / VKM B-1763) TaxID=526222 RepID=C6C1E0_MARSD|nr:prephenate dehydratase [Maridesulfovibrio salexigens]ACS81115.1 prephenate dehydratase [Maridesulfovibrio salexigens DSM 2638]
MSQSSKKNLGDLRVEIDSLDSEILELLNKRAAASLAVGAIKAGSSDQIFKPFREQEVLRGLIKRNPGTLPPEHLEAIYREIISSSRRLQRPERVVYLGPEGTFSYFAGLQHMGRQADLLPKNNFEDIFVAVSKGEADLGIIPLENSLKGTVGQNVDLFMRYPVFIQAELYHRISHGLMTKGADISEIKTVYSHSKALEQCTGWLRANMPGAELVSVESTAKAAQMVADSDDPVAAVGHLKLANLFGLHVVAEAIEDLPDNWTRFLIIGPKPGQEDKRDKTSLLFTTPDRPGALVEVLNELSGHDINMTKLESRPALGEKWKYMFFVDLQGDLGAEEHASLIEDLKARCLTFKILGSYPAGSQDGSKF